MKVYDLSHPISGSMPFYPGAFPPVVTGQYTIENDGFAEKKITLLTHTGTHLDAPSHILNGSTAVDRIPAGQFIGRARVLDFTGFKGRVIRPSELEPHRRAVEKSNFVILKTGWSRHWGRDDYFKGYPVLSPEGAVWITGFDLKGLGVDAVSVDEAGPAEFQVHKILLGRGLVIVENLTNLDVLPGGFLIFCCFPLKIERGDGSPVRAVAFAEPDYSSGSGTQR